MKEVQLPSGATLKIYPAPFEQAKALYQAVLEEAKVLPFGNAQGIPALLKDIICYGFSSKRIEHCIAECMKRCTYDSGKGDFKIDKDTFEPIEARGDYPLVLLEVAEENILPFGKSLSVVFDRIGMMIPDDPK